MKIVKIDHFNEAVELFHKIGVDPYGIEAMAPKVGAVNILLPDLPCKVANILKQEMLSLGADAAVSRGSVACSVAKTDALIMGTQKQINALAVKIDKQPFGLQQIAEEIRNLIKNIAMDRFIWETSRRRIYLGEKTLVMGILNVTPDSFSDGKLYFDRRKAVDRGMKMADEGADMVDIGGESTRPGSKPVTARQEIARVIPVVEDLSKKIHIPISVDTAKAQVAKAALEAGAEIINDISALSDKKMASVVQAKGKGAGLILMHMRGTPENMQTGNLVYKDLMGEIISYLGDRCSIAAAAGIAKEQIVLDPGICFGKSYEDSCRIIRKLDEMKGLGLPVVIGSSRKSFIGHVTGGKPEERLEGTAATVAASILNGCHIIRVHDVAFMKKVAAMTDAIMHAS